MPIYEYRCKECKHDVEVLQKLSDPPLVTCPACGKDALQKLVSAAGFQLKGSGWYVTDFRGGAKPSGEGAPANGDKTPAAPASDAKNGDSTPAPAAKTDSAPATAAASPPPASPPVAK